MMMVVMKSLVIRNGGSPVVVIRRHMPTALGKVIPRCGILPAPYLYPPNYLLTISPVFKFKTISYMFKSRTTLPPFGASVIL